MKTAERFSNRVENYVKYRPGYPPELLRYFRDEMGLTPDSIMADVGSGTGISTKLFLENGNTVYAVEPNEAMRAAAERLLSRFPNFHSRSGWAEETGLPDDSVDFAVAAQAFHWFDPKRTREEFVRILKAGGHIVLIWNERQLDTTQFLREFEQLLLKFARDYTKVRRENVDEGALNSFFQKQYRKAVFANSQVLDLDGLLGRVLSSSYMPTETDESFPAMKNELESLVAKNAENGNIELSYSTTIYYTRI
jgi:SAM-dependent methyltransferase